MEAALWALPQKKDPLPSPATHSPDHRERGWLEVQALPRTPCLTQHKSLSGDVWLQGQESVP